MEMPSLGHAHKSNVPILPSTSDKAWQHKVVPGRLGAQLQWRFGPLIAIEEEDLKSLTLPRRLNYLFEFLFYIN